MKRNLAQPNPRRPLNPILTMAIGLALVSLCVTGSSRAAPIEMGRLFYTPDQRAQLENARAHPVQRAGRNAQAASDNIPAPLHFDGVVIRSDGRTTRWVNGKAQVGASTVSGLKPGQIRANGKVYEPYQVLRPSPAAPVAEEPTP